MLPWRTLVVTATFGLLTVACSAAPRSATPTYTLLPSATRTLAPTFTPTALPPTETRQPSGLPRVTNTPHPTATPATTLPPWTPQPYTPPAPDPLALSPDNAGLIQEITVWGSGRIAGTAWSPDRRMFAVAATIALDLYDTNSWQRIVRYPVPAKMVAFNPAGGNLTILNGRRVQWLDLATGDILREYSAQAGAVHQMVFSPGGQWLALLGVDYPFSGDQSYVLDVVNAATGEALYTRSEYGGGSRAGVGFSPDGRTLALTYGGGTRLLDADTGAELATFEWGGSAVSFMPDGLTLIVTDWLGGGRYLLTLATGEVVEASASPESTTTPDVWFDAFGYLQVTDLTTRAALGPLPYLPELTAVGFGPAGPAGTPSVLVGDMAGSTWSWDLRTGQTLTLTTGGFDYNGPPRAVTNLYYSEAAQTLLTAFADGTVRATLPAVGSVPYGLPCVSIDSARLSLAGDTFAALCDDLATVTLWQVTDGAQVGRLAGKFETLVEWKGQWFGVSDLADQIALQPVVSGLSGLTLPVPGYYDWVEVMDASRDGRWLAAGTSDATLYVWDMAANQAVTTLAGHQFEGHEGYSLGIIALRFSPVTNLLASAGVDGTVRLWNPDNGAQLRHFEVGSGAVNDLAFSADGRYLAASSSDGLVRVYGLPTP